MNHTEFFAIKVVDDIPERDFIDSSLTLFKTQYQPAYYRVSSTDLMRPEMISFKMYGTVSLWWLIMLVNGVFDPLRDLVVGQLLMVPNVLDIYDFRKIVSK